jgi:hypothetical protein
MTRRSRSPKSLSPEGNSKSEGRNPKEIRNPKSEIRSPHPIPHSVRSLRDTQASLASALSAEPMPESFAIPGFGFRISGLRISDFFRFDLRT